MKKIIYLLLAISMFFFSCKSDKSSDINSNEITNSLIPNTVSITYEQAMIVPQEYWFFKGIEFNKFIDELRNKTISGKIQPFFPMSTITLTKQDITDKFESNENFKLDEIKNLVFEENWNLDSSKFVMTKKVQAYSLVREYTRKTRFATEEQVKAIIARYDFSKNPDKKFSELTLLQKDVAYEVALTNNDNPEWLEGIQVNHVKNVLIQKLISKQVQAYSFMLRDTLTALSYDEVKQRMGEETQTYINIDETTGNEDTVKVDKKIEPSEIVGIAFIEDWYIDNKTMQIYKDVKGIGLVREYTKEMQGQESQIARVIPFFVYFSNHKPNK